MKRVGVVFALVPAVVVTCLAQPSIQWQKCLGGENQDYAYSVQQTSDGGYIVAGYSYSIDGDVSGNHGGIDYWVVKLDDNGNIQWQKSLGGSNNDLGYSIKQTGDGGYIIVGNTTSTDGDVSGNHGLNDYWVVKLDETGSIQWQKCLGGSFFDYGYSAQQTADGGYIVVGETWSFNGDVSGWHGGTDFWVVKLDESGNIQWQKCLGGNDFESSSSIQQTADGGYIVAGTACSNNGDVSGNHGLEDFWVVKLDGNGNIVWQKSLGGSARDVAQSITQTSDGGYIVAGWTNSNNGDVSGWHEGYSGNDTTSDCWVVKLDVSGNIVWQKCLGGTKWDYANSVYQTNDGGYVVAGYTCSTDDDVSGWHEGYDGLGKPWWDFWLVKLNSNGSIVWQKCLGGTSDDCANFVQQTSDGGYILTGHTLSNDGDVFGLHGYSYDYWVVKLSPDAGVSDYCVPEIGNMIVSPSPFNSSCIISAPAGSDVEIYDVNGRLVWSSLNYGFSGNYSHGGNLSPRKIVWTPDESVKSGVYFACIRVGNDTMTKRVVLIR